MGSPTLLPTVLAWLCLALAPVQAPPLPFEKAGHELLVQVEQRRPKDAPKPDGVQRRLAALHTRVRLGAFELWIPERVLGEKLQSRAGPPVKEFAQLAQDLVKLEEAWIDRMASPSSDLAKAHDAIAVLERWTASFRGNVVPDVTPEVKAAVEVLERHFFRRLLDERTFAVTMVVAPTRAQYLGLIGAAAEIEKELGAGLCIEFQRRASSAQLVPGMMVLAFTGIGDSERANPLKDRELDALELRQNNVHASAHMLSIWCTPAAPGWWGEGLALCDTIAVCGSDETVCTGHADVQATTPTLGSGSLLEILLWVTRHKSPYRGGASATWFEAPLRAAVDAEGLKVFDLDKTEFVARIPATLLGEKAAIPGAVVAGGSGAKKGFAELYRAWCAAFVHWLATNPGRDDSLLNELCRELKQIPWQPGMARNPLYEVAPTVTRRTIGASDAPDKDLEAAFVAWLSKKK